jgi:DNA-binding NarL/FixJ family response regulator
MITEVVREGLREILKEQPTYEVVAEVSDGKEAILKAVEIEPDIAVLADTLPLADGIDGIEATRQIHARLPKTKVLVFATHDNETLIEELLKEARGVTSASQMRNAASSKPSRRLRRTSGFSLLLSPSRTATDRNRP